MRRLAIVVGAVVAALVGGPRSSVGQVPVFPSEVDLVTVDAVVLTKEGRPVRGLTREDFVLTEDGKVQDIMSFEALDLADADEPQPGPPWPAATNERSAGQRTASYVLLVDDLGIEMTRLPGLVRALSGVMASAFRPGDHVTLALTSGSLWWSVRFPEGRDDLPLLLERARSMKFPNAGSDYISEFEAYQIANRERIMAQYLDRVVQRWMGTSACVSDSAASCAHQVRAEAMAIDRQREAHTRALVAAVDRAVYALSGVPGRKELFLFSNGFLVDGDIPEVRQVAGICREANVVVNFLDARGRLAPLPEATAAIAGSAAGGAPELTTSEYERRVEEAGGSIDLAEDTGGVAVSGSDDFGEETRRVLGESRAYYMLGYYAPPGKGAKDWRKLELEVKRPGVKVRARKGYTLRPVEARHAVARRAEKDDQDEKRGKDRKQAPDPPKGGVEVDRALLNTHDGGALPLRAMSYVLEERTPGKLRVQVAIEVDTRALGAGGGAVGARSTLHLAMQAASRGGDSFRDDKRLAVATAPPPSGSWTTFHHDLDLAPGATQVRVVVRDEASGRWGAVTTRVEVPPVAGLRLATPILTDELREPLQKGRPPQLVVPGRRTFSAANGPLICQLQVFGAPPSPENGAVQVEASYILRQANGTEIRRTTPSLIKAAPGGPVLRLVALPMDGLAGGRYELVVNAFDRTTGSAVERIEPFNLDRRPER